MKKRNVLAALMLTLVSFSIAEFQAWAGSTIQGRLIDPLSTAPLAGVKVVALTKTDVPEEQKRARLEATTYQNGEFVFRDAIPSRSYRVVVSREGYVGGQVDVSAPEDNKTRVLTSPLYLVKDPKTPGLFRVDQNGARLTALPRKQEGQLVFQTSEIPIWQTGTGPVVFLYCRTNSPEEEIPGLTLMDRKNNPDGSLTLAPSQRGFSVQAFPVGAGTAGEVVVLKVVLPKLSDLVYWGARTGSFPQHAYVLGLAPEDYAARTYGKVVDLIEAEKYDEAHALYMTLNYMTRQYDKEVAGLYQKKFMTLINRNDFFLDDHCMVINEKLSAQARALFEKYTRYALLKSINDVSDTRTLLYVGALNVQRERFDHARNAYERIRAVRRGTALETIAEENLAKIALIQANQQAIRSSASLSSAGTAGPVSDVPSAPSSELTGSGSPPAVQLQEEAPLPAAVIPSSK